MAGDVGRLVLIGVAGAAGALCRLGVANLVGERTWPWATFVINVSGAFALGLLLAWAADRWSPAVVGALGIGFLGSFTTFSTLTVDAVGLGETGGASSASVYVVASVALGLVAALAGQALGRMLTAG